MVSNRFDQLAKMLAGDRSRRSLIRKAVGLGGAAALVDSGATIAQGATPVVTPQTEPTKILFVMIGGAATAIPADDGMTVLAVEEMDERSVLFGDRPSRLVATIETGSVLDRLSRAGSGSDPMNIAVVGRMMDGEEEVLVMEVTSAKQSDGGEVTIEGRLLDDVHAFGVELTQEIVRTLGELRQFVSIHVFVDDSSCCNETDCETNCTPPPTPHPPPVPHRTSGGMVARQARPSRSALSGS